MLQAILAEARSALQSAGGLLDGLIGPSVGGATPGCGAGLSSSFLSGLLGGGALPGGVEVGTTVVVGDRRVRVVSLLGEGGFAYVYAVAPADDDNYSAPPTDLLALKRTLGPDPDRLAAAEREAAAAAAAAAAGPGTLPLLAAGPSGGGGTAAAAFHLLTPLAAGGTLADAVAARAAARLAAAGYRLAGPPPSARLAAAAGALPPRLALSLFAQAAAAVASCHAAGLVHCDVKPQNLLLMESGGLSLGDGEDDGRDAAPPPTTTTTATTASRGGGGGGGGGGGEGDDDEEDAASAASLRTSGAGSSRPPSAAAPPHPPSSSSSPSSSPTVLLADFGSARPAPIPIPTRAAALALVEWADAHTSPAYRPPELYDPPSGPSASLTPAVDVWGLGCVLYFLLAGGVSPFERGAGGAGGSLALAVLAGSVAWPDQVGRGGGGGGGAGAPPPPRRVAAARALAEACLSPNPADRPTAAEVAARARALAG